MAKWVKLNSIVTIGEPGQPLDKTIHVLREGKDEGSEFWKRWELGVVRFCPTGKTPVWLIIPASVSATAASEYLAGKRDKPADLMECPSLKAAKAIARLLPPTEPCDD